MSRHRHYLPAATLLAGLAFSLAAAVYAWLLESQNAEAGIYRDVHAIADTIEEVFSERLRSLLRMAKRWQLENGTDEVNWRSDALNIQRDTPGLLGLARVTSDGVVTWIEPFAGNETAINKHISTETVPDPLPHRSSDVTATVFPAINLVQGGRGFVVVVPLRNAEGSPDGALVANYRIPDAFEAFLPRQAYHEMRLSVFSQGKELISFGARKAELASDLSARAGFNIANEQWHILALGTNAYLENYHTGSASAVAVGGAALSILISYLVFLTAANITKSNQLVHASKALKKRQEMLDLVAGVSETDPQGIITYVNERFCELTGYTSAELLGSSHRVLKSGGHPTPFYSQMWQTLTCGETWCGEILDRTKSGESRWFQTTIIPEPTEGGEYRYTSIRFDVTDRVVSDLRLKSAINVMESGFALFDVNDNLVLCNKAFMKREDRSPEDLSGMSFEQIFQDFAFGNQDVGEATEQQAAWLESRLKQHRNPSVRPLEFQWTNGQWMRVTERRTPQGDTVGVWTDITEQKERESSLQYAHEQMEEQAQKLTDLAEEIDVARRIAENASKEKSSFLASMSHELRTPLNAILGFSEIIQNQLFGSITPPRYKEYADLIHESGDHLLSLINDILDLSKVEAGGLELDVTTIHTSDIIRQVAALTIGMAKARCVHLNMSASPDCQELEGDQRAVKQILVNIVSNAVKFTPMGGTVEVQIASNKSGEGEITVRDNGIGMTAAECERALQMYGQIETGASTTFVGTGLGLPLSKALAELHGGSLTLKSKKGIGTEVTVRLPRLREATSYQHSKTFNADSHDVAPAFTGGS